MSTNVDEVQPSDYKIEEATETIKKNDDIEDGVDNDCHVLVICTICHIAASWAGYVCTF